MTDTGTETFRFKLRRGPAAEWTTDNPVLLAGEPGFEIDTNRLKIGDGIAAWNDLDYFPNASDLVAGVSTVDGMDGDVDLSELYAAFVHAHGIADVTGLTAALAAKAATADLTSHTTNTSNPHGVTKAQVGLSAVNNTADLDKPVSTATAAALAAKADDEHEHVIADVTGLIEVLDGKADDNHSHSMANVTGVTAALADKSDVGHAHAMTEVTGLTAALAAKATAADLTSHTSNTSNPHGVTKAQVGLSAVNNTSDADKPISDLTATALAGKAPTAHTHILSPAPVALTDASTIATDASLASHFRVTLGGNRTLGNPTNPTDGQRVIWEIIQDSTGTRTLTLDTKFALGSDIDAFEVSVDANERDFMGAIYNSTADKWYVVALIRGY